MNHYLFDVDGTLTDSRCKMSPDFCVWFLSWMADRSVYLVTGSDKPKIQQQIPASILTRINGLFTSMANELYVKGKKIYENECNIPGHIQTWLDKKLCDTSCPDSFKSTLNYEYRPGMLNFSICGRDVTLQQRKNYFDWDNKYGERKDIVRQFNDKFNSDGFEACVGGEISIDIQKIGNNKAQAIKWVIDNEGESVVFIGDRCYLGGNDYAACTYIDDNCCGKWYNTTGPGYTKNILSSDGKL